MTEQILNDYFVGLVSGDILSKDLVGTRSETKQVYHYKIANIESNEEFIVTTKHLIKICSDVINHQIKLDDLTVLAFALEASDYFTWDTATAEGNKVCDVISNWSSPEIGEPITMGIC